MLLQSAQILDNRVKFVMDGMNKIVYEDDKQVVSIIAFKLRDTDGSCLGRTAVEVAPFKEEIAVV